MYRILLPLDDTAERARKQVRYVTSLPCAAEAALVVVAHSFTGSERSAPRDMKRVDRIETVRETVEALEEANVAFELRELSSPPAEGILGYCEEESVDEIVMGGRKRPPIQKAILGSVTERVILGTDVPVTVTGGYGTVSGSETAEREDR